MYFNCCFALFGNYKTATAISVLSATTDPEKKWAVCLQWVNTQWRKDYIQSVAECLSTVLEWSVTPKEKIPDVLKTSGISIYSQLKFIPPLTNFND
ncbi:MAG TPA: hypothetical protein ENI57_02695 [Ignavibacteria bacterium]|nr:hypothetical protein [Ignavibacteria bacterium]